MSGRWWISPTVGRITQWIGKSNVCWEKSPAFLQVLDDVFENRPAREARADRRRTRHRQGTDRGAAALPVEPLGRRVHQDELRRDQRLAARIGTVRPRSRRVHRRNAQSPRAIRTRRWRHVVSRRTRDHVEARAGKDPAHHRIRRVRTRRRQQDDPRQRATGRGDERRSARRSPTKACSGATCSTGSRST